MKTLRVLLLIYCGIALPAHAAESIQVHGLFNKKAALLLVDGQQLMLKIGDTKRGVHLISASSTEALVEIDGRRQTLALSKQLSGTYQAPKKRSVRISSRKGGHYWVQGQINDRSVRFIVDTGATMITINRSTAERLGIDYKKGQLSQVSTANGVTQARLLDLHKVTIGSITQYNVAAMVTMDDALPVMLLGNSFLSGVNMRTEDGVLILESRL